LFPRRNIVPRQRKWDNNQKFPAVQEDRDWRRKTTVRPEKFGRAGRSRQDDTTYSTSIQFDEKSKSVLEYEGLWLGMPDPVTDIEDSVDRLAGPKVWAKESDASGDVNHLCHR
jgi:hypothetical protein